MMKAREGAVFFGLLLFLLPLSPRASAQEAGAALIEEFYRLNDSGLYDRSARLFSEDGTLDIWAEGVNGRHWQERHIEGREAIRPYLEGRAFHRIQDTAGGPVYAIADATRTGDTIAFRLRPDRKSPNGRSYDPFTIKISFIGTSIRSMTVIEFLAWM
jgi:hypothetical protein